MYGLLISQRDRAAAADLEVMRRRGHVDHAGPQPLARLRVTHHEPRFPGQDRREQAHVCLIDVKNQRNWQGKIRRQLTEKFLERPHAPG
jgi:hypothetical protein